MPGMRTIRAARTLAGQPLRTFRAGASSCTCPTSREAPSGSAPARALLDAATPLHAHAASAPWPPPQPDPGLSPRPPTASMPAAPSTPSTPSALTRARGRDLATRRRMATARTAQAPRARPTHAGGRAHQGEPGWLASGTGQRGPGPDPGGVPGRGEPGVTADGQVDATQQHGQNQDGGGRPLNRAARGPRTGARDRTSAADGDTDGASSAAQGERGDRDRDRDRASAARGRAFVDGA